MAQSFGFVEEKLYEAEFFLDKFRRSTRLSFDARCYFSAFVSAARSVTLALQASMNGISGFDTWYEKARENLRADPLAPFFIEIRNDVVHTGRNPLGQVGIAHLQDALSGQMRAKQSHFLVFPDVGAKGRTVLADAEDFFPLFGSFMRLKDAARRASRPRGRFPSKSLYILLPLHF